MGKITRLQILEGQTKQGGKNPQATNYARDRNKYCTFSTWKYLKPYWVSSGCSFWIGRKMVGILM